MISVNIIKDETEAYIDSSTVNVPSASSGSPPPLNVVVDAKDDSEIVALGGAVGFGQKTGVGAAIGYNEIQSTILADLDKATLNVPGNVTVQAQSNQTIGGVVLGVGVSQRQRSGAAGSVGINIITNTIDAHINDGSNVTAGGAVSLSATDESLIIAIAGGVAASAGGQGRRRLDRLQPHQQRHHSLHRTIPRSNSGASVELDGHFDAALGGGGRRGCRQRQ